MQELRLAQMFYSEFVSAFNKRRYNILRIILNKYNEFIETTDLSDEQVQSVDLMFDKFISNNVTIKKYLYRK